MGPALVLGIGAVYLGISIDFGLRAGNWWMALVYFGYAIANVGLYKMGGEL